jgi:hypothetical protein
VAPENKKAKTPWPLRITYRLLLANQKGHGMQFLSSPSIRLSKKCTLDLPTEANLIFKFDPSQAQSLSQEELLAMGSPAFRRVKYPGTTLTDVADASDQPDNSEKFLSGGCSLMIR